MSLIGGSPTIRDKNETYPQIHIYDVIRLVLQHGEKTSSPRPPEAKIIAMSLIVWRGPNKGQLRFDLVDLKFGMYGDFSILIYTVYLIVGLLVRKSPK